MNEWQMLRILIGLIMFSVTVRTPTQENSTLISIGVAKTVKEAFADELDQILLLSKLEQQMISTTPPYSYTDYATFALLASGLTEDQLDEPKQKIDQLIDQLTSELELRQVSENVVSRSDHILQLLHTLIFERYDPAQNRIDGILNQGTFNCVSSAVFYAVACRKFDIRVTGVVMADHSLAQLKLSETAKFDIETTVSSGFDPSSKTGILDQFGQLTGFAYVGSKNYRQRKEVGDRQMLALIFSNRYDQLTKEGKLKEATVALYRAYLLTGDLPFTANTWENAINNYVVALEKEKRSPDTLYVLARFAKVFPKIKKISTLQYSIYINWTQTLVQNKNYAQAIVTAEEGLTYFPENQFLRQNLKVASLDQFYLLSKAGDFEPAFALIQRMTDQFPAEKAFEMLAVNLVADQAKISPIVSAEKHFLSAITKYPNNNKLRELFAYRFIKYAETLQIQDKAQEGIDLLERARQMDELALHQSMIVTKLVSMLNNLGLQLLRAKKYSQARVIIERGLELDPDSKSLNNNWDVVMLQWAQLAYGKGQFKESIQILVDGRKKSKRDKRTFTQFLEAYYNETALRLLDADKVGASVTRFKEGLKLLPNSETLKQNLDFAKSEQE
jgi:tetratricopeptide (TPR) repeat protein